MPVIGRVMGLSDLSFDIITSILRLLTTEEVLCTRLISRYLDSVVLDNLRHVIPYTDLACLNGSLVSRILYRMLPCVEGEVNDNNAVRLVTQLTSLASKVDHSADNIKHYRKTVCDALTVSKGRQWVLDNLGRSPVDSCNSDYTMVLAAWLGLEDVVRACLADGSPANPQLEHLGSGLYAAAYHNNESLLKLLIEHGADVKRREGFYGDALQLAAYRGSDAAIRILIWEIIYVNIHNPESYDLLGEYGPFGSPLGAAAAAGNETSVRILLTWESMLRNDNDGVFWHEVPSFLAVKNGRANVVQLLITFKLFGRQPVNSDGHTLLMAAIAYNQESVVRVLLDEYSFLGGSDLTSMDDDGVPVPITMAVERGLVHIVELLLSCDVFEDDEWLHLLPNIAERNANVIESLVERRSFHEDSPAHLRAELLFWALRSGNLRIAHLLCEEQDETLYLEYQWSHHEDILHAAARYNQFEILITLLEKDEANPNVPTDGGKTPLMVAAENQSVECINALLKNPQTECDACNHGGATALMYATKNGCPSSLQLFRFCDPNVVDNMGRTALELAMGHKNISAVEYLVRRDDLSLKKAFDTALNRRNLEVANSIISRKDFDPNANSSLHSALEHDERLVGLLLSRRDTDPNMISSNKAPLHLAIEKNSIESLRLLLAREDVDPNIVVNRLGTPLGAAVYHGNKQAMELLLTREDIDINRGTWKPLITAMFYNEHELVSLLLGDHRIAVHLQDGFGRTALTEYAGKGDVKVLRQLFSKDSTLDLNHRAPDGNTALLLAAESGCESTVRYLLDMGADVNAQNDFGQAPLHAAACYGHEGVMRLLIDYGANPDLEDENGDTPYIAAISAIQELRNTCGVISWNARMGPLWR